MKNFFRKYRRVWTAAAALVLLVSTVFAITLTASAEMENVYSYSGPELTMANIGNSKSQWVPDGQFIDNMNGSAGNGKYKFNTNSWAFWMSSDSLDFAYVQTPFNTGRGSIMTIETTLTSWDGTGSGSAGIHVRNSLDPESVGVYLCVRPGRIYLMYRKTPGAEVNAGIHVDVKDTYPISFKLELNKSKNNATGYYKCATDAKWIVIGNVPYITTNQVYTGLAAHSVNKSVYSVCEAQGLSIRLDAPEGYVVEEGEGGDDPSTPEETEPPIVLPEDFPISGNMLLRETFTDGDLFPVGDAITVSNPLWTVRGDGQPNVMVNSTKTNRYLSLNAADNALMMTAGDMKWTDYSVSAELYYSSSEQSLYESNTFHLIFRHKSVVLGGSSDYAVTLVNKIVGNELVGQYLQLNYRGSSKNFAPTYTTLKEVCIAEGTMVAPDVTHTVQVDAMDNTYTVYFDGECVLTWDDSDRANMTYTSRYNETNYPNLTGCIGVCAENTYLQVDNIVVRKLYDPIGGDYDNEIGGGFDQPIPDYIKDKYGRD